MTSTTASPSRADRWLLVLLLGLLVLSGAEAAVSGGKHRILVLQSYNSRFSWTKSIEDGLASGLRTADWDIWYEYLDTKNLPGGFDMALYDPLFAGKYRSRNFELVVTVDDPAYEYFVSRRETLFQGLPGVAIGLNAPPPVRLDGVSYIVERPDFGATLNLALAQRPLARTIHIVLDRSVTGLRIRRSIEQTHLDRAVSFDWIDSGDIDQIAARVQAIPPRDILVFGVYFAPDDGYQSNDRILNRIQNVAGMPVYGFWTFSLAPGSIGGFLFDGGTMGRQAAELIRKLGAGGRPEVYIDRPQGRWIVDWPQTRSYGFTEEQFPVGTEFLNRPQSRWQVDPAAVLLFLGGFLVLAGFTVLILFNLRTQRALVAYGEEMIATQRELMQNLGNVIENRSQETASHVERITVLSLLLADHLGLPREQRIQLEVSASMHDIGKVGIPDDILKKQGRLTPQEIEVMKTHTRIGHSIFRSSPNPLVQAAARIALEHHEHWDGGGYPDGKAGEDIDILARIVSVVDVMDALLSVRTYKEAWPPEQVRAYLEAQSGRMFDPRLAALVLGHWEVYLDLWKRSHRA